MRWYVYLITCFLAGFRLVNAYADTIAIHPDVKDVWIGQQLDLLKDTPTPLTVDEIRSGRHEADFFRIARDIPTLGYFAGNSYWARFTLQNPTDAPIDLYLISRYATTDYLTLHSPIADNRYGSLTLGDLVPFDKRPIEHHFPIFPLTVPPGSHTYYLHMETTTSVLFALSLWTPRNFQNHEFKETSYLGLLFGICFVMLFYNFFVWMKFRSRAYLAYVGYILSYVVFAATYHGLTQQYIFPHVENGWPFKNFVFVVIEVTCVMAATFSIEFLYLRQNSPRLYRLVHSMRLFFLLNFVNWLTFNFEAKLITMIDTFVVSVVLMSIGFYRSFSYRPARFYTVGWTLFLTGNLVMLLGSNGVIKSTVVGPWAQLTGAVLELVLLSLALGDRMALINAEREKLQGRLIQSEREKIEERENHIRNLDRLVFERTREVKSILATINQGIFTIGLREKRLQVVSEYSQFLTTILGTTEIYGRDPIDLVFAQSNLSTEVVDQMRQLLVMGLGENRVSYEINSVHLVREIVLNQQLFIEIDWLPVLNQDETVDGVLVILRDVTQMRQLREQARLQEHELLMMGELTTGPGRKFPKFQKKALEQIQPLLSQHLRQPKAPLDRHATAIFLHSIKGDARVYGLRSLAQAVHEAESTLQTLERQEQAAELLGQLVQVLDYYDRIWKDRLHFHEDNVSELPNAAEDLSFVLRDQLHSVKLLATELGKPMPEIVFQGSSSAIPETMHTKLSQAFGHILTNSVDHGGGTTIRFKQQLVNGFLEIEYSDNGRGLDLASLQKKAKGLLKPEDIAELIFLPGLSTAKELSLTSGRGVGMSAVRELLESLNGSIHIRLGEVGTSDGAFRTFSFEIRVPLSQQLPLRVISS